MPTSFFTRSAVVLAIVLGFASVTVSARGQVPVDKIDDEYPLSSHLEILRDPTKNLDIDEVRSAKLQDRFVKNTSGVPSFGYTDESFWVRFKLHNATDKSIKKVLELAYPTVNELDVYIDRDGGSLRHISSGMAKGFAQRDYDYHHFLFDIDIPPQEIITVYIRFFSFSSSLIPLVLWEQDELISHIGRNRYALGIMAGIFLMLIIYNGFLYFPLKDRSYLYYIVFLVSSLFYQLSVHGLAYQMLWPDSYFWGDRSLAFFVFTTCCAGILFTLEVLNLKTAAPVLEVILRLWLLACGLGAIAVFLPNYALIVFLSTASFGVLGAFLFCASVYLYIKGVPHAGEYLVSWCFIIVGGMLVVLKFLGILPTNFFTNYGVQIGTVLQMAVFSNILSNRIGEIKAEVIAEEQRRIASEEKNALLTKTNILIRKIFGRYITDDIVQTLLASPDGLAIGGENRVITILMSDLRGFTALSERMAPEDVVGIINIYLSAMTDVIIRYGGTINEFIGDAVLAFFGAPISKDDHAAVAVACAIEMEQAMAAVNADCLERGYPELQQGIGIHTGSVVVGNIGSFKRAKYGAVGTNINLTSRIVSAAGGGEILVSEATTDTCGPIVETSSSTEIKPRGFTKMIRVFSVTGIGGKFDVRLGTPPSGKSAAKGSTR